MNTQMLAIGQSHNRETYYWDNERRLKAFLEFAIKKGLITEQELREQIGEVPCSLCGGMGNYFDRYTRNPLKPCDRCGQTGIEPAETQP